MKIDPHGKAIFAKKQRQTLKYVEKKKRKRLLLEKTTGILRVPVCVCSSFAALSPESGQHHGSVPAFGNTEAGQPDGVANGHADGLSP
jgi:hypothetical protein